MTAAGSVWARRLGRVVAVPVAGVLVLLALWPATTARAVELQPGDILITERNVAAVSRLDPATGERTTVSQGGLLASPAGVAVEADGDILVADPGAFGFSGAVIRVDPDDGAQMTVSRDGVIAPASIAVAPDGGVFVTDGLFGAPVLVRVDPVTGAQTTVSSGGSFFDPFGVAVEPNADVLVGDVDAFDFEGAVFRVDPFTGAQTTVSRGGSFVDPGSVAVESDGDIIVADRAAGFLHTGAVFRVDRVTGGQTTLTEDLSLVVPIGVAVEPDGHILVVNAPDPPFFSGAVIRIDPVTGGQSTPFPLLQGRGTSGIAVVAVPTSTRNCRHGGWRRFGFKNQGQCIKFVVVARVCKALKRRGHKPSFCPPKLPSHEPSG
jgi:streptogramin lyase